MYGGISARLSFDDWRFFEQIYLKVFNIHKRIDECELWLQLTDPSSNPALWKIQRKKNFNIAVHYPASKVD